VSVKKAADAINKFKQAQRAALASGLDALTHAATPPAALDHIEALMDALLASRDVIAALCESLGGEQ
jgi:hypothetical protein